MDLLNLLKSKRRCLERFLALSEEFLSHAEKGELGSLADFHERREAILRALTLYDRKLSECAQRAEHGESAPLLQAVREWNTDYQSLVIRISAVDRSIMDRIQAESLKIQEELAQSRRMQATVGKFKSGWVPDSGEALDKRL